MSSYALRPLNPVRDHSTESARRLSTIVEDGDGAPAPPPPRPSTRHNQQQQQSVGTGNTGGSNSTTSPPSSPRSPNRLSHRPFNRLFWHGEPPRHNQDIPPPPYTLPTGSGRGFSRGAAGGGGGAAASSGSIPDSAESAADREKLLALRNRKFLVRRGGWKRVGLCVGLLLAVIVGLTIGLVLGLRGLRNTMGSGSTTAGGQAGNGSAAGQQQQFPVGSYAIPAFLDTVSTDCTSDAATWNCYPAGTVYSTTRNGSSVVFDWDITSVSNPSSSSSDSAAPPPQQLRISTADNPFTVRFANLTLTLQDANQPTERYTFETAMPLTVIPSSPITADGRSTSCTFPSAMLMGRLFTKVAPKLPLADHTMGSSGMGTVPWPGQVEFEIRQPGGMGVPSCHYAVGAEVLGEIPKQPSAVGADKSCGCFYQS